MPRLSGAPQPFWVAAGKEEAAASPLLPGVLPTALPPPQEHSPKGKVRGWGLTRTHLYIIYMQAGNRSLPLPGTPQQGVVAQLGGRSARSHLARNWAGR